MNFNISDANQLVLLGQEVHGSLSRAFTNCNYSTLNEHLKSVVSSAIIVSMVASSLFFAVGSIFEAVCKGTIQFGGALLRVDGCSHELAGTFMSLALQRSAWTLRSVSEGALIVTLVTLRRLTIMGTRFVNGVAGYATRQFCALSRFAFTSLRNRA